MAIINAWHFASIPFDAAIAIAPANIATEKPLNVADTEAIRLTIPCMKPRYEMVSLSSFCLVFFFDKEAPWIDGGKGECSYG